MSGYRIHLLITPLVVIVTLSAGSAAWGQVSFQADKGPNLLDRPKVSPYLNLLRDDISVLSPYHTFVQPRQEAEQQQRRQWTAINQLQSWSQKTTQRQPTFQRATGGGGQFMNYSHYYRFGSR